MTKKQTIKKGTKRVFFAYLGIAIGLILLLSPFLFSWYTANQNGPAKVTYEKKVATKSDELIQKATEYNKKIFQEQQSIGGAKGKDYIQDVLGKDLKDPLGFIDIPSIHLKNMMIYYGDSDYVLNRGIGNMDWTSLPSGGKNTMASLTGHSGLANQIYFDNIRYLKKGDMVFLNTFGKKFAYEITGETKVIDPYEKGATKNFFVRKDQDMIVLMTCTPIFINSHRLLVFAKRVPYEEAKAKKHVTRDYWSIDHIFIMIVLLLIILILCFLLYKRHRQKILKKRQEKLADSKE